VYVLDILTIRVFDYLTSNCVNLIYLLNNLLLLSCYSYKSSDIPTIGVHEQ
jgi:hypothetical protein